ncbi:hypothetical protein [Baekduia soli]|uniref:hypothetical protein n=1 Tax=Baekduia soli TaxID=496014 RepID=UPI0016523682|nr:hypothetical protein [Baekduia soli]
MSRPDLPTLVSGLAAAALGVVLLLDRMGDLSLDFGSLAPSCSCSSGRSCS